MVDDDQDDIAEQVMAQPSESYNNVRHTLSPASFLFKASKSVLYYHFSDSTTCNNAHFP